MRVKIMIVLLLPFFALATLGCAVPASKPARPVEEGKWIIKEFLARTEEENGENGVVFTVKGECRYRKTDLEVSVGCFVEYPPEMLNREDIKPAFVRGIIASILLPIVADYVKIYEVVEVEDMFWMADSYAYRFSRENQ